MQAITTRLRARACRSCAPFGAELRPHHLSKAHFLGWSLGCGFCDSEPNVLAGETMHPEGGWISIWFFIGILVFVYGVLILGAGRYEFFCKFGQNSGAGGLVRRDLVVTADVDLGGIYACRFFPRKEGL
jgi:hypothetical protein